MIYVTICPRCKGWTGQAQSGRPEFVSEAELCGEIVAEMSPERARAIPACSCPDRARRLRLLVEAEVDPGERRRLLGILAGVEDSE